MRLRWPFSKADDRPNQTGAPEPDVGDHGSTEPAAWTSMPPLAPTVGDAPLVAPTRPFLSEVPGTRPLPPIVGPLGHEVSPLATPGLVVARTTTGASVSTGAS